MGMPNRALTKIICSLALLVTVAANDADAQGWSEGARSNNWATCPVSGSMLSVAATTAYAGYWTDVGMPNEDGVSYIHAVAWNISGGCVTDAVGFDFFLPPGASFAVDAKHPVFCFRGTDPNNFEALSTCWQTPMTGNFGGSFFGWGTLANGQFLEIQVPVRFSNAGYQPVMVKTTSAWNPVDGNNRTVPLTVAVNVPVPPGTFANHGATSNAYGTQVSVSFDIDQSNVAGQLVIEYASPSQSFTTPPLSLTAQGTTHQTITFTSSPATHYYWRAKFITQHGVAYGPVQELTTSASIAPPPTYCRYRGGC